MFSVLTTLEQLATGVGANLLCPLALITMLQHLVKLVTVRPALLVTLVGYLCSDPCMLWWL